MLLKRKIEEPRLELRGKGWKSKRKKETVEHNDTLQLQNVFGEEVNKKGEEQRINRQREKETKEKESGMVKNKNYAERDSTSP